MFYVYILHGIKNRLYIGFSTNLRKRLKDHKIKWPKVKLLYYEAYQDEKEARNRETKLKVW